MDKVTSINPKQTKLQEVNSMRVSRGLSILDSLHHMWEITLTPFLTLQDLASGTKDVRDIANKQKPQMAAIAAEKREAEKPKVRKAA